jgi:integrase/recombinase XerD
MMGAAAMEITLRYLVEDRDRHGNPRIHVRVPGRPKVRIREIPGTEKFMDAYRDAIAGKVDGPRQAKAAQRGSFRHLCQLYMSPDNPAWTGLDASTQSWQRRHLEALCETHADKPAAMMTSKHVRKVRDKLKATPAAANKRVKAIRAMFKWAVEDEDVDWIETNPAFGVQGIKYVSAGHHTWTADEVEQYKRRHKLGTLARLALDLVRFSACRREDVPRLGPQHIRDGRLQFRQAKNEHRNPIDIEVPVHPELDASIAAMPCGHLTFLMTERGRPFTTNGFGNKFKDWCRQADMPHCAAHGVRKATPTRMAENSATPHEIMVVTGHKTLSEVERYTRAANTRRLADSGMAKFKG